MIHHLPPPAPPAYVERVLRLASADVGVPHSLLHAVAVHESALQSNAKSKANAIGVMQTLAQTAHENGCAQVKEVRCEIYAGARYLSSLLIRYHGHTNLALAAYNAGPGAVDRYHGIPPFKETKNYVRIILADLRTI